MRRIETKIYPEIIGGTTYFQRRDPHCTRACWVTTESEKATSFCKFYITQIRPAKNELREFCDICDEK